MTGLNGCVYWGSSFLFDLAMMAVASLFYTFFIAFIGSYDTFDIKIATGVMFLMFLAYGFATISFSYLLSRVFGDLTTAGSSFTLVMTIHFLSGTICTILVYSLEILASADAASIGSYCLSLFPTFAMSWSIMRFTEISNLNSRCGAVSDAILKHLCDPNAEFDLRYRSCCRLCTEDFPGAPCFQQQPYLQWFSKRSTGQTSIPEIGIGLEISMMVAVGGICLLVLAAIECRFSKLIAISNTTMPASPGLMATNVCKRYNSKNAISMVNLSVKPGDLFILTGRNGSGKSTLLRILTGDETPSKGYVTIGGVSMEKYLSNIGYCPQHNGLLDTLTGKEVLELFVNLWGYERRLKGEEYKELAVNYWINSLGLKHVKNQVCGKYTAGLKRRLSVALALIGNPSVVILDEPTAGVDPEGQRRIWNIIGIMKGPDKSILVSTHDIEGCEQLWTRFGIMSQSEMMEYSRGAQLMQENAKIMIGRMITYYVPAVRLLILKAVAQKYRLLVEKFGCEYSTGVCMWWLILRGTEDQGDQLKFKQKMLDEVLLFPGELQKCSPKDKIAEAENIFLRKLAYQMMKTEENPVYEEGTFADIEHNSFANERSGPTDPDGLTIAIENFTVAEQRKWFGSKFNRETRNNMVNPMLGKSCHSQDLIYFKDSLAQNAAKILSFTVKIANRSGLKLCPSLKYFIGKNYSIEGPKEIKGNTIETFYIRKAGTYPDQGEDPIVLHFINADHVSLTIACLPLENGKLLLSGGLWPESEFTYLLLDSIMDLPTVPDAWEAVVIPVAEHFESFAKFEKYLARIEVPVRPHPKEGSHVEVNVEILKIGIDEESDPVAAKTRFILDHVFWSSSIFFQRFYVQILLKLLNEKRKWDCVALVDIENFLNVSLKLGVEKVNLVLQDCTAGQSNSTEADNLPKQDLNAPAEILRSTREHFYKCGSMPMREQFSYEIESTGIWFQVNFEVKEKGSWFQFAFLQPPTIHGDTPLGDTLQSITLQHRDGLARNGEKALQVGNIIALINMTEPKCRKSMTRTQFRNSQLSIRIFAI